MVKVYSTPSCVYCKTLKEYLKKNNVKFEDIDVASNEKELERMIKISGQMGVPVVEIDEEVITGFDKQKIDQLLKIKK
jgi:glutaredoxin-like YruB-family protein